MASDAGVQKLVAGLRAGERRALAKAITLVESTRPEHRARADAAGAPLSFCGEAAGRPVDAVALAAIGFRALSMRPAAIGRVKFALRGVDLGAARAAIDGAEAIGVPARKALTPMVEAALKAA